MKSKRMEFRTFGMHAIILFFASLGSVSAHAATIGLTYSFEGEGSGPPVQSGTNLLQDNVATGYFLSGISALDAKWNPVSFTNYCTIDLTTGLLNGTITFLFADGSTLFADEFEDVRALVASGGTGAFTETYTFKGGTGQFAGASGSVSGGGVSTALGFTESGRGSLTAAAVTTPEPGTPLMILGGLLVVYGKARVVSKFRRRSEKIAG